VVSQLLFVDINLFEEDKCISLLFFVPNSRDNVVVTPRNNVTTLKLNYLVASPLSEEMIWKTMDSQTKDALSL
jgi:hypothetical protein